MKSIQCCSIAVLLLLLTVAAPIDAHCAQTIHVAVSIVPYRYFVERIGGDHVDVTVMVPPGAEVHTYEPRPRQLTRLSGTDIYFSIGISFEHAWLDRFRSVNETMSIVALDSRIDKIPIEAHHHDDHDHGHVDGIPDTHIWLSPPLVKVQADMIRDALITADPDNAPYYNRRYSEFAGELDAMDSEFRELFREIGTNNRFIVFHPSWGYFAHEYGLEQIPIEIAGNEPKPSDLARLISLAKDHDITAVFIQPQFSAKSATMVAREIGGTTIEADPLAGDWANNLRDTAHKLREALK